MCVGCVTTGVLEEFSQNGRGKTAQSYFYFISREGKEASEI